ncbi:MAG: tRNA (5-methylaminomethyl-2-thiouridine)(34)-methyltransferase MnmD [Phycisphaerales bacterium JB063]
MNHAREDAPHFDEAGHLVAPRYGDRYHSDAGGLAETTHVFLEGNLLAPRFERLSPGNTMVVGETGFGTGLNFLACWQLFEKHAMPGSVLHYFSVEKHPLPRDTMRQALTPWESLRPFAYQLLKQYQPPTPGRHTLAFAEGRVVLSLLVGEAAQALSDWSTPAHAWFLDGFTPARNPGMWSPEVFAQVARLARPGTTLATYTAAGFVRRGLASVGFEIEKRPGYGTKRDMTAGRLSEPGREAWAASGPGPVRRALVVGAGVAGSLVARELADRGWAVTVAERQPIERGVWPTLRDRVAIVQPKVGDRDDPAGQWLRDGFARIARRLGGCGSADLRVGWDPCGVFHAAIDPGRAQKLRRFVDQFETTMPCRWIDADETHAALGVALKVGGVVLSGAGMLRLAGLCAALLDHPNITLKPDTTINTLNRDGGYWLASTSCGDTLRSPAVIVANAVDALRLEPTAALDLIPVRGQASLLPSACDEGGELAGLRRVVCGAGYLTPAVDGAHTLGASFVVGDTDTRWRDAEHTEACDLLRPVMSGLAGRLASVASPAGWVGIRCTTPTRQPYAGPLVYHGQQHTGLYTTLGHGSHGIVSACQSATQVADAIESDARTASALR